jgi:hypothetical protein
MMNGWGGWMDEWTVVGRCMDEWKKERRKESRGMDG